MSFRPRGRARGAPRGRNHDFGYQEYQSYEKPRGGRGAPRSHGRGRAVVFSPTYRKDNINHEPYYHKGDKNHYMGEEQHQRYEGHRQYEPSQSNGPSFSSHKPYMNKPKHYSNNYTWKEKQAFSNAFHSRAPYAHESPPKYQKRYKHDGGRNYFDHGFRDEQRPMHDEYVKKRIYEGVEQLKKGALDPIEMLSSLDDKAKLALTKALVETVGTIKAKIEMDQEKFSERGNDSQNVDDMDASECPNIFERHCRSRCSPTNPGPSSIDRRNLDYKRKPSDFSWVAKEQKEKRQRVDESFPSTLDAGESLQEDVGVHEKDANDSTINPSSYVCPHCPEKKELPFQDYKFHLASREHHMVMKELNNKYTRIVHKLRGDQRVNVNLDDKKWAAESFGEYNSAVSRFCKICKLVFRCPRKNVIKGTSKHNSSKYHKMQRQFVKPRCMICDILFSSRMAFEYHKATVNHLGLKIIRSKAGADDIDDDLEKMLSMDTLDAGLDNGENASEQNDITGELNTNSTEDSSPKNKRSWKMGHADVDADESDEDNESYDSENENCEDITCENSIKLKPIGLQHVTSMTVFFCNLCHKLLKTNGPKGNDVVDIHCISKKHRAHYHAMHPNTEPDFDNNLIKNEEDLTKCEEDFPIFETYHSEEENDEEVNEK